METKQSLDHQLLHCRLSFKDGPNGLGTKVEVT